VRFDPNPNDLLKIGQDEFVFPAHPRAPNTTFCQAGRKGEVYQIKRVSDGQPFALKVFIQAYRGPYILEVVQRISAYADIKGMEACRREVLTRDKYNDLITSYPDLEYAVIMPWVGQKTWHDIVHEQSELSLDESLLLAKHLAEILRQLEDKGAAHCDISSGNVLIDMDTLGVFLVDVEDLYGPGFSPPTVLPQGTDGYQHARKGSQSHQWCAEGDRFSAAVLLAEMLAWHDPKIREQREGGQYFAKKEVQDATSERYRLILEVLSEMSTDIGRLFQETWLSETLQDCPMLKDWARLIADIQQVPSAMDEAISSSMDLQILQIWQRHAGLLNRHAHAELYRDSAERASARYHAILQKLRHAIMQRDDEQVWEVFRRHKDMLGSAMDLTSEERQFIERVRGRVVQQRLKDLERAMEVDDDVAIAEIYDPLLFQDSGDLGDFIQTRVNVAIARVEALKNLRLAIDRGDPSEIIRVYDQHVDLLRLCSGFTAAERLAVVKARSMLCQRDLKEAIANDLSDRDIVSRAVKAAESGCIVDEPTQKRLRVGRRRILALNRLEKAIKDGDDRGIILAYNADLLEPYRDLIQDHRRRVEVAQERLLRFYGWRRAMMRGDYVLAKSLYDRDLFEDCQLFTPEEREHWNKVSVTKP
jgi:serine/threonine protein kinase